MWNAYTERKNREKVHTTYIIGWPVAYSRISSISGWKGFVSNQNHHPDCRATSHCTWHSWKPRCNSPFLVTRFVPAMQVPLSGIVRLMQLIRRSRSLKEQKAACQCSICSISSFAFVPFLGNGLCQRSCRSWWQCWQPAWRQLAVESKLSEGSGMTSILTVEDPSLFFKIWQNRCPRLQS